MRRTTKYVTLDVHQATTVEAVREQSGRVIPRSILPTEAGALVEFFPSMFETYDLAHLQPMRRDGWSPPPAITPYHPA